jgi:hypothetical protein
MLHRVFDVIHADAIEFVVGPPDAHRENFDSMEAMAKALCESIGLQLEAYDLFQRIKTPDGKAVVRLWSARWVANQKQR